MIFLTIGSHEPFDRLVRAFDEWCGSHPDEEALAQIAHVGENGYRPHHCDWTEKLGPADYAARFAAAKLVVSHAGMGSIITAMDLGKPLVVMPRRGHLQETRNDHQWATAQRFAGKAGLFVADDEAALAATMDLALANAGPSSGAISSFADAMLTDRIRDIILG
jgi:UDP-N-acetylglucosamine transferase subunit ALG13